MTLMLPCRFVPFLLYLMLNPKLFFEPGALAYSPPELELDMMRKPPPVTKLSSGFETVTTWSSSELLRVYQPVTMIPTVNNVEFCAPMLTLQLQVAVPVCVSLRLTSPTLAVQSGAFAMSRLTKVTVALRESPPFAS